MKKIALLLFLSIPFLIFSQKSKSAKMGQTTLEELKMKTYAKDSTAIAVVLYEQGNTYMNPKKNYRLSTDYYYRIKILKKEGKTKGIVKIPFYKKELVEDIKAITYSVVANKIQKKHLLPKHIFLNKETDKWSTISFTLPNINVGSVIEFKYTFTTPYFQNLDDWNFQSDIPKIKSEYESAIVGNYLYNVSLRGFYKLDKKETSVLKSCVQISGMKDGHCAVLSLGMNHIPAFKEELNMTSAKNFIASVAFELESYTDTKGYKTRYTDTWKSADKRFKSGEYFGSELRKSSFFKKRIPAHILSEENTLEKAKKIYYFIQNHYTNNGKGFSYRKIEAKKSFNNKLGNIADINVALFNALKAGGIQTKIALLSTRKNGVPTKVYPVISEFNYIIVSVQIDGKTYFLDATNKQLTFGLTPFYTLNGEVRIMDFKKGSYWQQNSPSIKSSENVNLSVKITEDREINGLLRTIKTGYNAFFLRNTLANTNEEDYLEDYEATNNLEINDYKLTGESNKEQKITQVFNFTIENSNDDINQDQIYFNPFFHEKIQTNPFQLNERLYPVNFGYKRNYTYRANIAIPKNYKIAELPKSKAYKLPNNGGNFLFNIKKVNSKITIFFKFQLRKIEYTSDEYFALKAFFNLIIKSQATLITLEKKQ